jgi:hypothetical protein
MSDHAELIEKLKDLAYDVGARSATVVIQTDPDAWTTIRVRHAGADDSPDGWTTTIEHEEL